MSWSRRWVSYLLIVWPFTGELTWSILVLFWDMFRFVFADQARLLSYIKLQLLAELQLCVFPHWNREMVPSISPCWQCSAQCWAHGATDDGNKLHRHSLPMSNSARDSNGHHIIVNQIKNHYTLLSRFRLGFSTLERLVVDIERYTQLDLTSALRKPSSISSLT